MFKQEEADSLLEHIKTRYGLDYTKQKSVTYRKIERFALSHDLFTYDELARGIQSDNRLETELINLLTVCETYFFREKDQIDHAAALIHTGKIGSILCAPCSSGEEVYSLLLATRERGEIPKHLKITGIDINTNALEAAVLGNYSSRSISSVPKNLLENFFEQKGTRYIIEPRFKDHTFFKRQNIFDASIFDFGKFDAIFSRNMMIYFTDEEKRKALEILRKLLKPEGLLFVGHADITFQPQGYRKIYKNRTVFYQLQE
ncbi:CheR family methyltransferase [Hydrogenimonas urashimensis]|uniref:CheR family methyltransferase n=1 Tax=Hydrogenimonas urashimensis TaxID=2740515 RepID=UPI001915CA7B|nr:CheR family methyltransferase [Hydrogenimonas urashimensis]